MSHLRKQQLRNRLKIVCPLITVYSIRSDAWSGKTGKLIPGGARNTVPSTSLRE
jgi:hypothetical protein